MPHLHISTLDSLLAACCFEQLREQARRPSPMQLCPSPYLQPPPTILQENRPPSPSSPGCAIKRKQGLGQTNRHSFGPTTSWTLLQLHPHALPFPKPPGSFLLTWLSCALLAPAAISHPPWQSHVPHQTNDHHRYMMHACIHAYMHTRIHT